MNIFEKHDMEYYSGDSIWYVERDSNILCRIDNNNVVFCGTIPYYGEIPYRMHPYCIHIDGLVICLPDIGETIVTYDCKKESFSEVKVNIDMENIRLRISNFWIYNGRLWCVSQGLSCIIEFDYNSNEIVEYYRIFDNIDESKCGYDSCMYDNKIFCISLISPQIGIFDIEKKEYEYIKIDVKEKGFNTISVVDNEVFLSGYTKKVYSYNLLDGLIMSVDLNDLSVVSKTIKDNSYKQIDYPSPLFRCSILTGNNLCYLPWYMLDTIPDSLVIIDRRTKKVKYLNIKKELFNCDIDETTSYLYFTRTFEEEKIEIYLDNSEKRIIEKRIVDTNSMDIKIDKERVCSRVFSKHYLEEGLLKYELYQNDLLEFVNKIKMISV